MAGETGPCRPALARPWLDRRQTDLLCERYVDILLGEPVTTLLLLAQAPFIAGLIVLA